MCFRGISTCKLWLSSGTLVATQRRRYSLVVLSASLCLVFLLCILFHCQSSSAQTGATLAGVFAAAADDDPRRRTVQVKSGCHHKAVTP